MAAIQRATRPDVQSIKADLSSTSTCTSDTVAVLQALLIEDSKEPVQKENVKTTRSRPTTAQSTTRRRAATKTGAGDVYAADSSRLTRREKYMLATDVANCTLKLLSDSLKDPSLLRASKQCSKAKASPKPSPFNDPLPKHRGATSRTSPNPQKPLQELPLSQATNSPQKRTTSRRTLSDPDCVSLGPNPGIVATAECARLAFAYLRTPEAATITPKGAPPLQLENGMVALVGKLVAHGLDNYAVKELRVLKRRLEVYTNKSKSTSTKAHMQPKKIGASKNLHEPPEKETLASLLMFSGLDLSSDAVPVVISHQLYVLRVIAASKRPRVVEAVVDCLKTSNPSSPANLILQLSTTPNFETKAARQLESLAQVLLTMCPSVSTAEDEAGSDDHLSPAPDVALHLQYLAFWIRRKWWRISKHQGNVEKELWEPFAKCLAAFSRRSAQAPTLKYKIAKTLYEDLLSQPARDGTTKSPTPAITLACKVLSSLALNASLAEEALRWTQADGSPDASNESAAKTATRLVRLAALSLESSFKNGSASDWERHADKAMDALRGSLGGSSHELDCLFVEVNGFRKAATKTLIREPSTRLLDECPSFYCKVFDVVSASMRFILRYVGSSASESPDTQVQVRQDQRVHMASKTIKSIMDSAVICSKQFSELNVDWPRLGYILQDVTLILQRVEQCTDNDQSGSPVLHGVHLPLAKISNAYWASYLQLRTADGESSYLLSAMQKSVDVLLARPNEEQQAGSLSMKLEKLGEALDAANHLGEARASFRQSLEIMVRGRDFLTSVELAAKCPVQQIFHEEASFTMVGRLLRIYHTSFITGGLEDNDEVAFFDNDALAPAARGLLLEFQLSLFAKSLSKNRPWDVRLNSSLSILSRRLLESYSSTEFPTRRLRVLITLLDLAQQHLEAPPPELLEMNKIVGREDRSGTQDDGLSSYNEHLRAMLRVKLAMREESPSITQIKDSLQFWQSVVSSADTWTKILERINDPDHWLQQLQAIADYLAAKAEEYLCVQVLNLLSKVLQLKHNNDSSLLLSTVSRTGLQLLRLGYSEKAGLCFARAEALARDAGTSIEARLQWHLGYAEYLLALGNTERSENILASTEKIASDDAEFMTLSKTCTTLSGRVRFNRLLADSCYVHSLLALRQGRTKDALKLSKRCVTLYRRVWAALENNFWSTSPNQLDMSSLVTSQRPCGTFDPFASLRTESSVPVVMSLTHQSLNGASFWFLVPPLHRALSLQAQVYSHLGLLHEAVYSAEQADKIASAIKSSSLLLESASQRIEYWAQSGRSDKAQAEMKSVAVSLLPKHLSMIQYYSSVARVHQVNQETDKELAILDAMQRLLNDLQSPSFLSVFECSDSAVDALVSEVSALSLGDSKTKTATTARSTRGRKPAVKAGPSGTRKAASAPSRKTAVVKKPAPPSASEKFSYLCSLQADAVRRQALANLVQDDLTKATELLEQAGSLDQGLRGRILHLCTTFKVLFAKSMSALSTDFIFNALPESTIAFPALSQFDRRQSESSLAKFANPSASKRTTAPQIKNGRGKKVVKEDFVAILHKARECLNEAHTLVAQSGSAATLAHVSCALSNLTVLLSAASHGEIKSFLHPLYAAYMTELPKSLTFRMAQEAVEVEQEKPSREGFLKWPQVASGEVASVPNVSQFQQDYIDIIPNAWTAISLALSEDHNELYITKYHANQSPFVLRLPLARHTSRDMDEEEFGYDDGRRDFDEIIELSDFSTKTARDMTAKGAKTQWWAEREALDTRLKELLINIENIWLGGFKGIFSQDPYDPDLLARFKTSFQNILNRHLPSRRARGATKKLNLEPRILQLFIGLGDATNEKLDLDEALMDLVYFVVDILQFNGERNAYDEIDFDAIVIETLDALRAYHNAARSIPTKTSHTILILDRNLHVFPWESLPCLQSLSISRLPSLAALRERLLAARSPAMAAPNAHAGHYILTSTGGTSILNPGGDLANTSKVIKPKLDELQGKWTHISNRAPSETEFENALRDSDLVLYFGHGSGAQFVRSRNVKRLYQPSPDNDTRCATTFLFGCSSAHLTENGIYEPSGMLASYLIAGAPAVLGMLWDVTDKDCDRFAVRAGEVWGLWPEGSNQDFGMNGKASSKNSKGKGKVVQDVETARNVSKGRRGGKKTAATTMGDGSEGSDEDMMDLVGGNEERFRRGVGLDEAVRDARDACVLRYLNGAAAVVYGIPVYLE